jgi:SSS family solute:Na+ symporter
MQFILGVGFGFLVKKTVIKKNAEDYFLASKSLPRPSVPSLIAQHFSRAVHRDVWLWFCIRISDSLYEWMAAFTLIIVGKYFLPILSKRVFILFLNL